MFNITSDAPVFIYTSLGIFRDQKSKGEYCLRAFNTLKLEFTAIDLAVLPKHDTAYVRSRYLNDGITQLPILIASGGTYEYDEINELIENGGLGEIFRETCEWNFIDFQDREENWENKQERD